MIGFRGVRTPVRRAWRSDVSRPRSGPTVEHRVLAARLRLLREVAGKSLADAAAELGKHTMTVRRIEAAETALDIGQIETLLRLYRVPPREIDATLTQVAAASRAGWWHRHRAALSPGQHRWIGVESSASLIRVWHPTLVPDVLRTPRYAAALHALCPGPSTASTDEVVAFLLARQRRLRERGVRVWALLGEAALHAVVGDAEVMAEQRQALREAVRCADSAVQVMPLAAPPHPLSEAPPLRLLRIPAPEIDDHAVWQAPGGNEEVTDAPSIVGALRQRLDAACAAAPPPTTQLPTLEGFEGKAAQR
ncbi:helix-turn-helix transcriptional regulator [Streptomyces sp. AC536]|nr:helix-turn-helix transcriptional regulator [Streptomyces buecherae]QNJ43749.1 helix-turn-helix transcriptional regulator [Streptomyces buecherae]